MATNKNIQDFIKKAASSAARNANGQFLGAKKIGNLAGQATKAAANKVVQKIPTRGPGINWEKWTPTIVGGAVLGGGVVMALDKRKHGRSNRELYRY